MSAPALRPALSPWGLPEPDSVRSPERGSNNITHLLEVGRRPYVLRVYQNLDADRVAAEHRLLAALAGQDLGFAVPSPLPTMDGCTWVDTEEGVAALFAYLPGRMAYRDNPTELELIGQALGDLDLALARLPLDLAPIDWRRPLHAIHPAVPDLHALIADLLQAMPGYAGALWLAEVVEKTAGEQERLWASLPVQIIHGDMAASNVLVEDGRVSAVLDFEIAGADLRVTDLVGAILQCTDGWWEPGGTEQAEIFLRGYHSRLRLTPEEYAAFPTVLRLRAMGSAIWRAGRWKRGQSTLHDVRLRLQEGQRLEQWLTHHESDLPR
ncbi:phosphotransferase enzyme family protein [Hamadaea tsunoensis]|uniref:phosphotransferase enzyme family protein n=1 Tax=Hamadaea tsunoensis TaxID=53368 RepID=UPI0004198025|nr:phosphotransferase [Hamadaea tsunoensis]